MSQQEVSGLCVSMPTIKDMLEKIKYRALVFTILQRDGSYKYYICTHFTLTLNRILFYELEPITKEQFEDEDRTDLKAADADDIISLMEELQVTNHFVCLCRLPGGDVAGMCSDPILHGQTRARVLLLPLNDITTTVCYY